MRIYSRLHSNCQIIIVLDRVQSTMGVGYSFTDKLIIRNYGRNYCIREKNMRYKNDNSNNKTSQIKMLV